MAVWLRAASKFASVGTDAIGTPHALVAPRAGASAAVARLARRTAPPGGCC